MNTQIIGIPTSKNSSSDYLLDERVRKMLKAFTRSQSGQFLELQRGQHLADFFNNDASKRWFYLEVPGMRTANGRQKHRFVYEISSPSST